MLPKSTWFKRSIVVLLIVTMFGASAVPARADLTSIVGNLGPVVGALVSCNQDKINQGLNGIFGSKTKPTTSGVGGTGADSVPTSVTEDSEDAKQAAADTAAIKKKQNCTLALEKAAAQVILRQLTLKTINWINHGFKNGESIFIGDEATYLKNIRNTSIRNFNNAIGNNPDLYPFGASVANEIKNHTKSYFERNAIYSLDRVIASKHPGVNPKTLVSNYNKNFAYGGWDAFGASFDIENNPVGFSMAAKEDLANRVKDTQYSNAQDIKDQLQRNQGFLDLKKCIGSYTDETQTCSMWKTETPGSVISKQLDLALGSNYRQLELGQDLSSSITAIFNALANQLVQKGLSSLEGSKDDANTKFENNSSYASNVVIDDSDSSWTAKGNKYEYNIFDLNPSGRDGDGKENLIAAINRENSVLPIFNEQNEATNKLIPAIYQLDMCIPGPHPGWQQDAQKHIDDFIASLPTSWQDKDNDKAVTKYMFGQTKKWHDITAGAAADKKNEKLYPSALTIVLGTGIDQDYKVNGLDRVQTIMQGLLDRYTAKINALYTRDMPRERIQAEQEWNNIPKYQKGLKENDDLYASTKGLIYQLTQLQKRVAALPNFAGYPDALANPDPNNPYSFQAELQNINALILDNKPLTAYQKEVKRINDTFTLIAPDLHSPDDVAKEESTLRDIQNRYDDIAGKDGLIDQCIADTSASNYDGPTQRMPNPNIGNPDNLPIMMTYLPEYEYGTANVTENPSARNADGDVTATTVTSDKIISVWDLFTKPNRISISGNTKLVSELSPFEQLIGIY